MRKGEIWGSEPPVRSDAAYRKITVTLVFEVANRRLRVRLDLNSFTLERSEAQSFLREGGGHALLSCPYSSH